MRFCFSLFNLNADASNFSWLSAEGKIFTQKLVMHHNSFFTETMKSIKVLIYPKNKTKKKKKVSATNQIMVDKPAVVKFFGKEPTNYNKLYISLAYFVVTAKCVHIADMFTCCIFSTLYAQNRYWCSQNVSVSINDFSENRFFFFWLFRLNIFGCRNFGASL